MLIIDLIKEYGLIIKNYFLQFSYSIPSDWNNGNKGNVILIYGFNESWPFLKTIGDILNKKGYAIHIVNFNSRHKITDIIDLHADYIKNLESNNITLIGHSKGGLVARNLYENLALKNQISKCIIISTPNNGTVIGYLGAISLNELKPNSKFISDLNAKSKRNSEIYNFYSKFDNHIIPNKHLQLNGAINKMLDVNGHTRILESPLLIKNIKSIL